MLNIEQKTILLELTEWYDSNVRAINLAAKAGMGKTYVLSTFIKQQIEKEIRCTIIAPTHAAIKQLALKIGENPLIEYKTVAKALSVFPISSTTSTKIQFAKFKSKPLKGLVIVDESSMLGDTEIKTLLQISEKIVFSGDQNQLAPIKKKSNHKTLESLKQLTLTEMMRSSSTIAEVGYKALVIPQYVPATSNDSSVVCYETVTEFKQAFLKEVKLHPPSDCVLITYTNKEVHQINMEAHLARTNRLTLETSDFIRLTNTSALGKNNDILQIKSIVNLTEQYIINGVSAALPHQYVEIEKEIEAIVNSFKKSTGSSFLKDRLKELREIALIDFPYAITTHKSQGASIPIVFANSQQLHGRKSFYVAYTRAIEKLCVVRRKVKAKGARVTGTQWENNKLNIILKTEDIFDVPQVQKDIINLNLDTTAIPSISHLACVLNPAHPCKSAKGWSLG